MSYTNPPKGAEKYKPWFDTAAADAAVDFFPRHLRHTEGQWWNKPFVLSPWQEHIVRLLFGWKREDGTRLFRQSYIEVPRKNGKTEFAAGLALLVLIADGEFGGQGYSIAVNKEQARIVFNKAGVMISLSPALSQILEVYKTSIYCPELMASFLPLSSTAGSKHGFSPSFAIGDELHEWPDGELHDVVHKGTAARQQPLEILITTAGKPGQGYGWEMHEYALSVLKGNIEDPTFLPVIFAATPKKDDKDDKDYWTKREAWAEANPNLGISVKEEYLASEVAKATGNPRKIADFKRYHLNVWTDDTDTGLEMEAWDRCKVHPVSLETLQGRVCYAGLDLSSTTDLTALCLVSANDDKSYDAWWMFWLPSEGMEERVRRDRVPYDQWAGNGLITATAGNVVDYDVIRDFIVNDVVSAVDLKELAIDRWNATQITTQLMENGVTVVPFGQGLVSMAPPSKELERLVKSGKLNHGDNPVARWMASCVTFETDAAENIKPVKPDRRKSTKRIDGIVALIMALGRAGVYKTEEKKEHTQGYVEL